MFVASFFFFFQAEDGIRDLTVTGVQTCALPICAVLVLQRFGAELGGGYFRGLAPSPVLDWLALALFFSLGILAAGLGSLAPALEAAGAEPAPALEAGDEGRAPRRPPAAWPGPAGPLSRPALTPAGP